MGHTDIYDVRRVNPFGIHRIKFKTNFGAGGIVLYGEKLKFRINQKELLPDHQILISSLSACLKNHHHIQKEILTPAKAKSFLPLAETYWDEDWRSVGVQGQFYEKLHDILCAEIEVAARELHIAGKTSLKILDIPCGKNPLMETLLQRNHLFRIGFLNINFIMVDRSRPSIELCKSKSLTPPTEVTTQYEISTAEDFECSGCDIIISCGGLLHSHIAKDRDQAKAQLKKYAQDLNPDGYLITGGLSPIFVSASTMRKTGLEVIVGNCRGISYSKNLYVAKKPSSKNPFLEEKRPGISPCLPMPLDPVLVPSSLKPINNLFSFFHYDDTDSKSTPTQELTPSSLKTPGSVVLLEELHEKGIK